MNDDSKAKRSGWLRLLFLLGVFVCELLAVYSLNSSGWTRTSDRVSLILAICLALLPLVAALIVLFFRGRHFSLRSMLIATALLAIFISIIVYPIAQVRGRRRIGTILKTRGHSFGTRSARQREYERFGIPYRQEPVAETENSDDIRFWMKPLLGDTLPTFPDRAIRSIDLYTDDDVDSVADLLDKLPNFETVYLRRNVTQDGLKMVAERFPKLEALNLDVMNLPPSWGAQLKGVRYLSLRGDFSRPNPPHTKLSDQQLRDLASIQGLEVLSLDGIKINDTNAPILLEQGNLKVLALWRSDLTPEGRATLVAQAPGLKLRVGPQEISPEDFFYWANLDEIDLATIRVTYNEHRDVWGVEWLKEFGARHYVGEGTAGILKEFPIVIEIKRNGNTDPLLFIKIISRLERLEERRGLQRTELKQDQDALTITLIGKESTEP